MFGFQQTVGFPISTKCAPLADSLYSYEADYAGASKEEWKRN